jgi:hypothetical protein
MRLLPQKPLVIGTIRLNYGRVGVPRTAWQGAVPTLAGGDPGRPVVFAGFNSEHFDC